MAHKDIRIPFEIEGRRYEAVGYLEDGEELITADEMISRTNQDGKVVDKEDDCKLLWEHRKELPEELSSDFLTTKWYGHPVYPDLVFCFAPRYGAVQWSFLENIPYGDAGLVLRRLP